MRKFLLGIFCGLVLAVVGMLVIGFAAVRFGTPAAPSVESGSVLMLNLEGPIGEVAEPEMPFLFGLVGAPTPTTVHQLWASLRAAAGDSRIKAIGLSPRGVGAGWGKLEELREALLDFRKSGKPVVAWLRTPGIREYYLATAADKIYVAEEDWLNLKGMRAEVSFLKGTLNKLGIEMEVEHIGKYKDAGDAVSRTSSTPETREVVNSILDGVYGNFVGVVAAARKKSPEAIRGILDNGPYMADKALAAGLIDGLMYEDQFHGELRKHSGEERLKKVSARNYSRSIAGTQRGTRIALLTGEGAILRGGSSGFERGLMMSEDFIKDIRRVADDSSLRGAIVRIDSPGGDAVASDDILRELKLLSQKKPVVFSMSDVAASGGYFIACTGDPIVAYPNTITGSIGVVFTKPNLKGLYDKIGVRKEMFLRGRNAGIDSEYGPMTDVARAKLRESIQSTYDAFVKRVAEARKTTAAAIEPFAQGRAWLGSQAGEHKLVDEMGGLNRAIEQMRIRAKLGKDETVQLVPFPPRQSLWARLMSQSQETTIDAQIRQWLTRSGLGDLAAVVQHSGVMRVMPFTIDLQ